MAAEPVALRRDEPDPAAAGLYLGGEFLATKSREMRPKPGASWDPFTVYTVHVLAGVAVITVEYRHEDACEAAVRALQAGANIPVAAYVGSNGRVYYRGRKAAA
ncbi:MAG: hypothetical protein E6J20_00255 [Chloroflexi bacterium]|nr:MAG: hypothetical protein E6J20_00255 [Chloroflexota bacterium]